MPDKRSRGKKGKTDVSPQVKSPRKESIKGDARFLPRKEPGSMPEQGQRRSTTIPRTKAVLHGSNAGQDS